MTKEHKIAFPLLLLFTLIAVFLRVFTDYVDIYQLRQELGDTTIFWVVVAILQVLQVVFLPISNSLVSAPLSILFGVNDLYKVFLSSFIGVEIGTIILYFIGRFGGQKMLNFILGDKEKVEKCVNFINKGKAFYPIGMLIFIIPDDILTTLAGTSKYSFGYVLVVSAITRAICVASTVFGIGYAKKYPIIIVILGIALLLIGLGTILSFRKKRKTKYENN